MRACHYRQTLSGFVACVTLLLLTACAAGVPGMPTVTTAVSSVTPLTPATMPATQTAEPPVTTNAPCAIVATRTPAPDAPTFVPNDQTTPEAPVRRVDPHVEVCASPTRLKVGETLTIIAEPVDIGLPNFMLSAREGGSADWAPLAQVTYDNQVKPQSGTSAVVALVSAQGQMRQATFVLRAQRAGSVEITVGVTGEVHYGYPGPATWAGGGSETLTLQVTE